MRSRARAQLAPGKGSTPPRGAAVVAYAAEFLDSAVPLAGGEPCRRHRLPCGQGRRDARLRGGHCPPAASGSKTPSASAGYGGTEERGELVLVAQRPPHRPRHRSPEAPSARPSKAGLSDVILETALTTIQDCEDSVAAVDAEDKVGVYRNWLGLMNGTLVETFCQGRQDRHAQAQHRPELQGRQWSTAGAEGAGRCCSSAMSAT